MRKLLIILVFLISSKSLYSQAKYKFDINANVYGCANILLQKISKNQQYELYIEINHIDSLPVFKEFDLANFSKYVKIYLNKYPKQNKHIDYICNDVIAIMIGEKAYKPDKFFAKQGTLFLSQWNGKKFVISFSLKNVSLKDKSGKEILLPFEQFDNLQVGWLGG